MKIGVFVCWCGENIARTVDCQKVTEEAAKLPGVHCAETYKYMCSEPGQNLIADKIKELGLTAIVVAACSPHMHLKTFQKFAVQTIPRRTSKVYDLSLPSIMSISSSVKPYS
jgi:heterodisulfide reductase subunit A